MFECYEGYTGIVLRKMGRQWGFIWISGLCCVCALCIVFSLCLCRVEEARQYCVIVLAAQDQKYLDDDE